LFSDRKVYPQPVKAAKPAANDGTNARGLLLPINRDNRSSTPHDESPLREQRPPAATWPLRACTGFFDAGRRSLDDHRFFDDNRGATLRAFP
jgi:hypothetical protein